MKGINRAIKMWNITTRCGSMFPTPEKQMLLSTLLDYKANICGDGAFNVWCIYKQRGD